jgi:PAS domain S-box-containing protein
MSPEPLDWRRTERTLLEAVLQQLPSALIIAEAPSGRLRSGNQQVEKIFRGPFPPSKSIEDYKEWKGFHPDGRQYQPEEWPMARAIRLGETVIGEEIRIVRRDGTLGFVSVYAAPIRDATGQIIAAVVLFDDITDRKQAEQLSQQREQVSAEARSLAAAAHELKNPLQGLGNSLYLLGQEFSDGPARQYLVLAQQEVERIKQIASDTLGSFREHSTETEVSVSQILESSLEFYAEKIRFKQVTVDQRTDCIGVIKSLPVEIRQLFDNLLVNALEAVPMGGQIAIHLFESRDWTQAGRSGFRVVILDNGPGILPQHREKLFQPFFTTKAGKGTGIGLWVVQRIVQKHLGSIHVRSSRRNGASGTAFSIFLPTAAAADATDAPRPVAMPLPKAA